MSKSIKELSWKAFKLIYFLILKTYLRRSHEAVLTIYACINTIGICGIDIYS